MHVKHLWPGGARCVVLIGVDFDGTANEVGKGILPLGVHSAGRYSGRRGIARMLDLFDRHQIPASFFVPGWDAERHPEVVREIQRRGHEVAAHGYQHEARELNHEEERALLHKSHQILTDLLGKPPRGYRNPAGVKTEWTTPMLHELGYRYDSSEKDFDLPYMVRLDDRRLDDMVELPNNATVLDDFPFYWVSFTPASEVLQQWKDEFDALYAENGFFLLCVHPRAGFGSGSPARVRVMDDLIRYIKGHEGVTFMRHIDLAEWCLSHPDDFE